MGGRIGVPLHRTWRVGLKREVVLPIGLKHARICYLLPNFTASENVMAPLFPFRRKLDFDLKQQAKELLQSVGLEERLGHPPTRLSGGEQQRVAIARALINRPKLVLADEPTCDLDPATGSEVLEVLRDLQQTGNQTLILVTHDPGLAELAYRQLSLEQFSQDKS